MQRNVELERVVALVTGVRRAPIDALPDLREAGMTHVRLARIAVDAAISTTHEEAARDAWLAVGSADLIARYLIPRNETLSAEVLFVDESEPHGAGADARSAGRGVAPSCCTSRE
jgi:hypothetical protein